MNLLNWCAATDAHKLLQRGLKRYFIKEATFTFQALYTITSISTLQPNILITITYNLNEKHMHICIYEFD